MERPGEETPSDEIVPSTQQQAESVPLASDEPRLEKQNWTLYLIFCNISVVIGSSLTYGFSLGVINAPFAVMNSFVNETFYKNGQILSEDELSIQWSLVVNLYLIGGFLGSVWFPGALASAFGKKNALLVSSVIGAIGAIILVITPWTGSCIPLFVGRFVVGFQGGIDMIIAPDLITEQAPARLRGSCGSLFTSGAPLAIAITNLLGIKFILGRSDTWQYLFIVLLGFYVLHAICLIFVTESPIYLIDKGRDQEAITAFMKLRGATEAEVQAEFQQSKEQLEQEKSIQTLSLRTAFTQRQIWWPMIIVVQLGIVGEMTGLTAAMFYATKVMEVGGMDENSAALANFGLSLIAALGVVVNIAIVDRFGRRLMLIAPLFVISCANSMLVVALYYKIFQLGVAGFAVFVFAYGCGPGILPIYMTAEMFPQPAKPLAYAVGMFSNWFASILISFVYPEMQLKFDQYSFLPFVGISLCEAVFFVFFLPETSSRLVDYDPDRFASGRSLLQLKRPPKIGETNIQENAASSDSSDSYHHFD